jgi:hypothetical protein
MLNTNRHLPLSLQRRVTLVWDALQLAVLRRSITLSREVLRFKSWLQPIRGWMWALPCAFIVGIIGGVASRLA